MQSKKIVGCLLAAGLLWSGCDDEDETNINADGGIDASSVDTGGITPGDGGSDVGPVVVPDSGTGADAAPLVAPHMAVDPGVPAIPDVAAQPAITADPWSMAQWFQGMSAQPPLNNQLKPLALTRETGLWTPQTPFLGPATYFAFNPQKPWQGQPVPDYIVPTTYVGAFNPQSGNPWTLGWTVGIHGNKVVWDIPTNGTLAGRTPVADGTCPVGTTVVGKFGTLIGPLSADEGGRFSGPAAAGDFDVCGLPARFDAAGVLKLTNDNVYALAAGAGTLIGNGDAAGAGATGVASVLEIEPGTLVYGLPNASLFITRGAKIMAVGDVSNPIVFTSRGQLEARFDGDVTTDPNGERKEWGGLVLSGRARDSRCPQTGSFATCDTSIEAAPTVRASGDVDNDSSGSLKYVISRNGGSVMFENQEINAITLYSAGSGTLVDYVQGHMNSDDGIEFFGGTVSVAHVALTDNADDSFDWGHGWTGSAQFVFIRQAKDEADRAIEADNYDPTKGGTANDLPISFPQLANFTVVGPPADFTDMKNVGGGFLFRRGTKVQMWNAVVMGAAKNCVRVDGESFTRVTTPANPGAELVMRNTVLDCVKAFDIK